jgi:hypothetical protein
MKELDEIRRYKPIEYDEMPGDMVSVEDFDDCLRELNITRCALRRASKVQRRSLLLSGEVYEQRDSAQVDYHMRLAEAELYPETEQPK